MNILMLGRWLPPPRRPVRATREYQFAAHLARTHRLTLAFIADNPDSAGPISALRSEFGDLEFAVIPRGWKSLASAVRLATGESCTLSYFRSEALRTRLGDRLRRSRYDLVFVSSSTMIQYAFDVEPTIPMVMDFGSVGSEWWLQQAVRGTFPGTRFFRTEAARLRAAEAAAARRAALLIAETPEAGRIVESLSPGARPIVVPSGVDVAGFSARRPTGKVPTVIFNTSLRDEAEVEDAVHFCASIVPAVRARVPQTRFVVASRDVVGGSGMTARLKGVELLSSVSDLRFLFHDRTVAVAPLRAGFDVRSSVLEAMAAGVPVVTTSRVRDHLGADAGRDLGVADAPVDFAERVIEFLQSGSRRHEIGANGSRFVRANFSWEVFGARLETLLTAVGTGRSATGAGPEARPMPAAFGG
jgi:glycosyltransferase involved in cell wall biosynthesis